ncbi:copper amine oxidase N-terminal domain-containing protein [Paenibacillus sp. Soil522]|uniref:copper amine oxidase N-terminal domain-containing protein n=1 Tax=Paenibacillus sp. Soil522 TaxID=1736388 RepID=UPI0006F3F68A|nr:copper amine oxidase N-terminal domain-containing protein [Paenibacillus sp. Soil522]KRE22770.1 hypothetical protein ASG81_28870 [Paenibacillus sp. Soil522]
MKIRWSITVIILALTLILPTTAGAAAHANYRFNWDGGGSLGGSALVKNGVSFVPMTPVKDQAQLDMKWDTAGNRAQFDGWEKSFAIRVGSLTGMLDGKIVKLEGAPFIFEKELYLPARFVVHALNGGTIAWDARSRTVKAGHLQTFKTYTYVHDGLHYSIEPKSGTLYVTDGKDAWRELAKLGTPIYDYLSFSFQKTPRGLLILNLHDNYGEPHINNQLFTLIIKDGKVIAQSSVYYWKRFEQNVTQADGQLILNDGHTLRLIEDGTGEVTETLDLLKLGGEEDLYFIEYIDKDVLLIRPGQKGLLMLVDRETGRRTMLYKELLDAKHQEYAEFNDTPYHGDFLKLVKREGDILYFKNEYPYDKDNNIYSLTISE